MLCIIIETASGAVGDRWKLCSCSPHHPLCGSVKLYASLNCSQSDRAKSEKKEKEKKNERNSCYSTTLALKHTPVISHYEEMHQQRKHQTSNRGTVINTQQRDKDIFLSQRELIKKTQIWFNLLSTFCKSNELYKTKNNLFLHESPRTTHMRVLFLFSF